MSGPTKGGISPSTVAIPTSHGSSIRRRASLKTQNAVASQKTATKNAVRLRITVHVLWLKKSKSPFASTRPTRLLREAAFRPDTRRRTRGRRSSGRRRRQPRRRSGARRTSPWYALKSDGEVGEQIERSGHEHGALLARQLAPALERSDRIGRQLDPLEEGLCADRQLVRRQCP